MHNEIDEICQPHEVKLSFEKDNILFCFVFLIILDPYQSYTGYAETTNVTKYNQHMQILCGNNSYAWQVVLI